MYTILHISDLHRTGGELISNSELLSSLIADFARISLEIPDLGRPDAIVVSGDLVEGLTLESDQYPDGLRTQYREAAEFLATLSDEFLDGDRSRVVIVPGNHDVDWNGARMAFSDGEQQSDNPRTLLRNPETLYRWSWSEHKIFRITDVKRYERRFEYFNEMYRDFYQDTHFGYPVDPERPWNLFNLDNGNILVAAFNSCVFNDCFSDLGHIRSADLADCHLEMRRVGRTGCLPMAVWHHGVGGPPATSDFVDPATVRLMIDKGFRLGLHGHRHDSTHSPADLFVSTKETMAVIGAGSLCSGPRALPHGVNRRYNIMQIDREKETGRVYVREMNQPNIWGPGQLFESGGQSYLNFNWTPSTLEMVDQSRSGGAIITKVDELEALMSAGRFSEAGQRLLDDTDITPTYRKRLLAKVFRETEAWTELKNLVGCPENDDELAMYVLAAERSGDITGVAEVLTTAAASGEIDSSLIAELHQRIQARSTLGR